LVVAALDTAVGTDEQGRVVALHPVLFRPRLGHIDAEQDMGTMLVSDLASLLLGLLDVRPQAPWPARAGQLRGDLAPFTKPGVAGFGPDDEHRPFPQRGIGLCRQ